MTAGVLETLETSPESPELSSEARSLAKVPAKRAGPLPGSLLRLHPDARRPPSRILGCSRGPSLWAGWPRPLTTTAWAAPQHDSALPNSPSKSCCWLSSREQLHLPRTCHTGSRPTARTRLPARRPPLPRPSPQVPLPKNHPDAAQPGPPLTSTQVAPHRQSPRTGPTSLGLCLPRPVPTATLTPGPPALNGRHRATCPTAALAHGGLEPQP